jgi:predicted metal-dependent hydrolase
LMLLPDEVIDSVVAHELCHRKHMNHSAAFYAELTRVFPDYRRCRDWLKENGGRIMSRLS